MTRRSSTRSWLLVLASFVVLAACQSDVLAPAPTATRSSATPDLRSRTFQMGLSSLPPQLTEDSYSSTFQLAGGAGDVILIQRTPPWSELLSGSLSDSTVETTKREVKLAEDSGLDVFVAIDPTDPATGRAELAGLPPGMANARFADDRIRRALLTYARYIATNYHPKYLAFGVEINSYQRAQPEDFEQFVSLYHEVYTAVKDVSAGTMVFPTFQLEDMQGYVPVDRPKPPQWYLLNRFEPNLDLFAVSTYPRTVFPSVDNLPVEYFTQLRAFTNRPIAIVGTGYPSGPAPEGSESEQSKFLLRTLDDAQTLGIALVVWFISQDPTFTGEPPFDRLQYLGLRQQDGTPKEAWDIWLGASRRPLVQPGG